MKRKRNQPMEEQLQSDPFLQLLTEALRAGPGSPEWHQAVARVKAGETGADDEYTLLVNARENLASAKAYREVRAGVGFTRKLLASIEVDAATTAKKSPISASLISYLGAGLVVATIAVVIFWVIQGSGGPVQPEDLTSQIFSRTAAYVALNGPLPTGWKLIGALQLDPSRGLAPAVQKGATDHVGGAVVSTVGAAPTQLLAVEAAFSFQHVSDEVIPQLFVTDDPNFNADKATSAHELVWMVRGGLAQVALPNGELTTGSKRISDGQTALVRIVVGAHDAAILCDGQILWTGANQLAADKPRYVGVRLLCRKEDKRSIVQVKDLKEMAK